MKIERDGRKLIFKTQEGTVITTIRLKDESAAADKLHKFLTVRDVEVLDDEGEPVRPWPEALLHRYNGPHAHTWGNTGAYVDHRFVVFDNYREQYWTVEDSEQLIRWAQGIAPTRALTSFEVFDKFGQMYEIHSPEPVMEIVPVDIDPARG